MPTTSISNTPFLGNCVSYLPSPNLFAFSVISLIGFVILLAKKNDITIEVLCKNDEIESIIINGIGNFTGVYTIKFEIISKIVITESDINYVESVTFNGKSQVPTIEIIKDGITLEKDTHYSVSYTDSNGNSIDADSIKYVGTYNIIVNATCHDSFYYTNLFAFIAFESWHVLSI